LLQPALPDCLKIEENFDVISAYFDKVESELVV
jgi:hypothetical protein